MTHLLHTVAAFLLALVGYSAGAVLASGRRDARPGIWELPAAGVAAAAAAVVGPDLLGGWLALPAAVGAGAGVGLLAGTASRAAGGRGTERAPRDPHAPERAVEAGDSAVRGFLLRVGDYQGRITMGFLYFGLLAPFALVSRLTDDPLRLDEGRPTYWRDRASGATEDPAEDLRRQA